MGDYAARRGSARLPIDAPVQIRFPGVDEAYEGVVGNVGMSGMFIAGGAPMPAGTLLHFEFRPSQQWHRLRGRGRIVWARQTANAEGEPPGMGIRFIELDERGRRGVRWLIETFQAVGDKPFETWSVPSQFTRQVPEQGDVLATQEIVPVAPASAAGSQGWLKKPWPLLAAGLAALILVAGWALLGGDDKSARDAAAPRVAAVVPTAEPEAQQAPSAAEPEAPQAAPTSSTNPAAPPARPATTVPNPVASNVEAPTPKVDTAADDSPTVRAILTELVGEWAAAWSSQDADRYLTFYAPSFSPETGQARAAWARQRVDRLAAPEFIRISIDAVQVLDQDSDMPRTVFTQSYESNTFSDKVTKSLTWIRSQGTWRILNERSAP